MIYLIFDFKAFDLVLLMNFATTSWENKTGDKVKATEHYCLDYVWTNTLSFSFFQMSLMGIFFAWFILKIQWERRENKTIKMNNFIHFADCLIDPQARTRGSCINMFSICHMMKLQDQKETEETINRLQESDESYLYWY